MGLAVLPYMPEILNGRENVVNYYANNLNFNVISPLKIRKNTFWNFSYYPIIFESEEQMLEVQKDLNLQSIFPRRYFYPSLSSLNYVSEQSTPITDIIVQKILCLPLYPTLKQEEFELITSIINSKL